MMTKRLLIAVFAVGLMAPPPATFAASTADAQERTSPAPAPPPPPAPPAAPGRPAPPDAPPPPPPSPISPRNVQLDIVITDTISGKPEAKRVTLVLRGNGGTGSIRTSGNVVSAGNNVASVELALDGNVRVLSATLVDVTVTFTYAPPPTNGTVTADASWRMSTAPRVVEGLTVTLHSGRPLLVSRSADPVTNRTVTVELTATIREP
jgi:hypothetical protein